jgi:hypothetical protein
MLSNVARYNSVHSDGGQSTWARNQEEAEAYSETAEIASRNVAMGLMPDGSQPPSVFTNIHLLAADEHRIASQIWEAATDLEAAAYHERRRLDHCAQALGFFTKMEPLIGEIDE